MTKKKEKGTPDRRSSLKTNAGTRERSESEKKRALLDQLRESLGIALFACRAAGVSYGDYERWTAEDAAFAEEVRKLDEAALDFVEGKALEEIRNGNATLIRFYLQTKGRSRGYGREEKEGAGKRQTVAFLSEDEMEY